MQQIAVKEERIAGIHFDIDQLKTLKNVLNTVGVCTCLVTR